MNDGSVVTWGNPNYGGDHSSMFNQFEEHGGVDTIYSASRAFAAKMKDGSVVTWGQISDVKSQGSEVHCAFSNAMCERSSISHFLLNLYNTDIANLTMAYYPVITVSSTKSLKKTSFVALIPDGSVVNWGNSIG
jgi:hypothetical protein